MVKKKSIALFLATCMILGTALAGCGSGAGDSSEGLIKIGVSTPLSAPGDTMGGGININTLKLAAQEINDAGGVDGRKVELVIGDDAGTVSKGVSLVQKFATTDKVSAILGVWHGPVASAQATAADEFKVPIMSHYSWPDDFTEAHSDYVFRVSPYNSQIAELVFPFILNKGYRHVAVVAEDGSFGMGYANALKAEGEKNGVQVSVRIVPTSSVDPTPQLIELKNMNPAPDLLVVASVYQLMYTIPKQARAVGLDCDILASWDYPSWDDQFWPNVGDAGVGIYYPSFYSSTMTLTESGQKFQAAYRDAYGESPPIYAYFLYDEFMMIMQVIKEKGSSDPSDVAEGLANISFNGTTGVIEFTRDPAPGPKWNQWLGHQIFVFQLENYGDMGDEAVLVQ